MVVWLSGNVNIIVVIIIIIIIIIIWWRNHDRRSNRVDTVHECDRQTDGQNYDN